MCSPLPLRSGIGIINPLPVVSEKNYGIKKMTIWLLCCKCDNARPSFWTDTRAKMIAMRSTTIICCCYCCCCCCWKIPQIYIPCHFISRLISKETKHLIKQSMSSIMSIWNYLCLTDMQNKRNVLWFHSQCSLNKEC